MTLDSTFEELNYNKSIYLTLAWVALHFGPPKLESASLI